MPASQPDTDSANLPHLSPVDVPNTMVLAMHAMRRFARGYMYAMDLGISTVGLTVTNTEPDRGTLCIRPVQTARGPYYGTYLLNGHSCTDGKTPYMHTVLA